MGIDIDDTHIYWADFGGGSGTTIGRGLRSGGGVEPNFITGAVMPLDVAVTGSHIYWTNSSSSKSIGRATIDGANVDHAFIAGLDAEPYTIALSDSHIYWTKNGAAIGRATLNGDDIDENFIPLATDMAGLPTLPSVGIAVNGSHVFWSRPVEGMIMVQNGWIGRANLDGGNVNELFAEANGMPLGMASAGANVYWIDSGGVARIRADGTGLLPGIAPDAAFSQGVAVDALPPAPVVSPPRTVLRLGKVQRNRKRGTAQLTVSVSGPGVLRLHGNKKVKNRVLRVARARSVKLLVKPSGKAARKLKKAARKGRRASVKVRARVTFTPRSGSRQNKSRQVKLTGVG